ncbi:MAG: hypothetical protein N4A76_06995 [Firmicutes bacterium]|jgi:ppGpp synthetase/RelA/SpoT-type nucleotidyltranferase|nr:hypothetical protein [Bacillota bacterium]
MKNDEELSKVLEWYQSNRAIYQSLCKEVKEIIEIDLIDRNAFYNSIDYRTKEINSFKEKCSKDKYKNPQKEIFDFSGLRIIAYTNSDVEMICEIIEEIFDIDYENSVNKLESIGVDQFGYLSVHYVASLPSNYYKINRYKKFKNYKFEIQIRTLLQHAWSEIEHDRNYKFKGALPKELKRRFYMIAGVLEMVDREFEDLTNDISNYSDSANISVGEGRLDLELNALSIGALLMNEFDGILIEMNIDDEIMNELKAFGVFTLNDLKKIIIDIGGEMVTKIINNNDSVTSIGLLRDLMITSNLEKYFSIWNNSWGIENEDVKYYKELGIDISDYMHEYDE